MSVGAIQNEADLARFLELRLEPLKQKIRQLQSGAAGTDATSIWGHGIPAPGLPEDGEVIVYDDTTGMFVWAAATAGGSAGGVLSGSYPNPGFAVDMATQAELDAAIAGVSTDVRARTVHKYADA